MKISFGSYVNLGKVQNNNEKTSSLRLNTLKQDTFTKSISFEGKKKTKKTQPQTKKNSNNITLQELNQRIQDISAFTDKEKAQEMVFQKSDIFNYYYSAVSEGNNEFISKDGKDNEKLNLEKIVKYLLMEDKIESLADDDNIKIEYQKISNKTEYKDTEGKIKLFFEFNKLGLEGEDIKVVLKPNIYENDVLKRFEKIKEVGKDIYKKYIDIVNAVKPENIKNLLSVIEENDVKSQDWFIKQGEKINPDLLNRFLKSKGTIYQQYKKYNEHNQGNNKLSAMEFSKKYYEISQNINRIGNNNNNNIQQNEKNSAMERFWLFPEVEDGKELVLKSRILDVIKEKSKTQDSYDKKIADFISKHTKIKEIGYNNKFFSNCGIILEMFKEDPDTLSYLLDSNFFISSQDSISTLLNKKKEEITEKIIKICAKDKIESINKFSHIITLSNQDILNAFKSKNLEFDKCENFYDFALKIMEKTGAKFTDIVQQFNSTGLKFDECQKFCDFAFQVIEKEGKEFKDICKVFNKKQGIDFNDFKNFCDLALEEIKKEDGKTFDKICERFKIFNDQLKNIKCGPITDNMFYGIINDSLDITKIGLFKISSKPSNKEGNEQKEYKDIDIFYELKNKKGSYQNTLNYLGISKEEAENLLVGTGLEDKKQNNGDFKDKIESLTQLTNYIYNTCKEYIPNADTPVHGILRIIERYLLTTKTLGLKNNRETIQINKNNDIKKEIKNVLDSVYILTSQDEIQNADKRNQYETETNSRYVVKSNSNKRPFKAYLGQNGVLISIIPEDINEVLQWNDLDGFMNHFNSNNNNN